MFKAMPAAVRDGLSVGFEPGGIYYGVISVFFMIAQFLVCCIHWLNPQPVVAVERMSPKAASGKMRLVIE
jgi:hypothetical protein